jgi:hypothetical protein
MAHSLPSPILSPFGDEIDAYASEAVVGGRNQ